MTTTATDQPLGDDTLAVLILKSGGHRDRQEGVCLMEAVAWMARERHSDHPACVCPVLSAFGRAFNDGLRDDAQRTALLKPFIPRLVGTKATAAIEEQRAFMAMDWLVRVHTPAWLDLREAGRPHAAALRALAPIVDVAALVAAGPVLEAARSAAAADRAAAWDAAWAAAWDAAWAAAWDAAWDAARDAAWAAAWDAARDAAWDAAWDAARAAAWDAARDAARDAAWAAGRAAAYAAAMAGFKPVVEQLQASALDLFTRMIAVGKDLVGH